MIFWCSFFSETTHLVVPFSLAWRSPALPALPALQAEQINLHLAALGAAKRRALRPAATPFNATSYLRDTFSPKLKWTIKIIDII